MKYIDFVTVTDRATEAENRATTATTATTVTTAIGVARGRDPARHEEERERLLGQYPPANTLNYTEATRTG